MAEQRSDEGQAGTILLRWLIAASHRIGPCSPLCVRSQVEPRMSIGHVLSSAAMSLMPPTPVRLVPGLLHARGLKVSVDRIRDALQSGVIPGRREKRYWGSLQESDRCVRQAGTGANAAHAASSDALVLSGRSWPGPGRSAVSQA
jgi:hypothetical protein